VKLHNIILTNTAGNVSGVSTIQRSRIAGQDREETRIDEHRKKVIGMV